MSFLSAISFATPWALAGLALLPVIWWLLRFTPPRPQSVRFPPLRLLLELMSKQEQPDKTPWWLMALRLALAALLILAVAHPLYAPGQQAGLSTNPLLVVVDDSWAAAPTWEKRAAVLQDVIDSARRNNRLIAIATTTPSIRNLDVALASPQEAQARAATLAPRALDPDRLRLLGKLKATFADNPALDKIWISDGLDHGSAAAFAEGIATVGSGSVQVLMGDAKEIPQALATPAIEAGQIKTTALRVPQSDAPAMTVRVLAANGRSLAEAPLTFTANAGKAETTIDLPLELRNEVSRLEIAGGRSASSVFLLDDRWRRKTVALIGGVASEAAQPLLSPLYYVSRALEPYAEIHEPQNADVLKERLDAGLSMLVLADIGVLPAREKDVVAPWIERGGVLLRFAGPRLAGGQDDLVPANLREGGRSLGSALSWETPQPLQAFPGSSPFAGLAIDDNVKVNRQVLAEPDVDLPGKVWASLADGTPLVTAQRRGKGMIILVHVTANADWSTLPLSGMFVEMLRRVLDLAPGAGGGAAANVAVGSNQPPSYTPYRMLTGRGDLADPLPDTQPIAARDIDKATPSPQHPPGLYARGASLRAINLAAQGDQLRPIGNLPSAVSIRNLEPLPAIALAPLLFAAAMALFILDCLAALMLSGQWRKLQWKASAGCLLAFLLMHPAPSFAQSDPGNFAMQSTLQTKFAYVLTGDDDTDETSRLGLTGLGNILLARTSVEPGEPQAIDIERDEIIFFPLIYWPIRENAESPSDAALARIDHYLKNGGTVLFDTREDGADFGSMTGGPSASIEALRRVLSKLDLPAIEPVPPDHVLTKSFYLLQSFPGRYDRGQLWVETGDTPGTGAGNADGVSSIIIGSNDYAAAWAQDANGNPVYAVASADERQREMAYRTGVNIVMYALTGNYKADQVHVPALLERLGQ
jgi:hypothetical protein